MTNVCPLCGGELKLGLSEKSLICVKEGHLWFLLEEAQPPSPNKGFWKRIFG